MPRRKGYYVLEEQMTDDNGTWWKSIEDGVGYSTLAEARAAAGDLCEDKCTYRICHVSAMWECVTLERIVKKDLMP